MRNVLRKSNRSSGTSRRSSAPGPNAASSSTARPDGSTSPNFDLDKAALTFYIPRSRVARESNPSSPGTLPECIVMVPLGGPAPGEPIFEIRDLNNLNGPLLSPPTPREERALRSMIGDIIRSLLTNMTPTPDEEVDAGERERREKFRDELLSARMKRPGSAASASGSRGSACGSGNK